MANDAGREIRRGDRDCSAFFERSRESRPTWDTQTGPFPFLFSFFLFFSLSFLLTFCFLSITGGNRIASKHGHGQGVARRWLRRDGRAAAKEKKWRLGFRREKEKKGTRLKHELPATIERTSTQSQQSKLLNESARLKQAVGTRINLEQIFVWFFWTIGNKKHSINSLINLESWYHLIEGECPIFRWVEINPIWWLLTLTIRLRRASPKRQCNRWTNSQWLPTLPAQDQPDHEDQFLYAIDERTRIWG
jgi:hypothetical protein